MTYGIVRFPFDGAVDADGHVMEPADLWENYLEDRYLERALRIKKNAEGLECLEIDGAASQRTAPGVLGLMGAMGEPDARPSSDRLYMENMPHGAGDPDERIDLLDKENVEKAILYPTLSLLWECEVSDPELTDAYMRAYNRWIADFCRYSGGRLVPVAHIHLLDPEAAATELQRAVSDGCKGAFLSPFLRTRHPHGHADHDALHAKAQELGVPLMIHPTLEPADLVPSRFVTGFGREAPWYFSVLSRHGSLQAFLSYFAFGTLERFPGLVLGVVDSGAGWIGGFLDRMDARFGTSTGRGVPLKSLPSTYFRRQCFISCDPDETAVPHIVEHVGADRFVWGSDYPHPDRPESWVHDLINLVEPLSEKTRARVLGQNAKDIYHL